MLTEEELNQKADKIINLLVPNNRYNQTKQFVASKVKTAGPLLDQLAQIKYPNMFPNNPSAEETPEANNIKLGIKYILGYEKLKITVNKMLQNGEPINAKSLTKQLDDENNQLNAVIQKRDFQIAMSERKEEEEALKQGLAKLQTELDINLMLKETIRQKKDFDKNLTSISAMEAPKISSLPEASKVSAAPVISQPIQPEPKTSTEASDPFAKSFVEATQNLRKHSQSQNQAPSRSITSTPQADAALEKSEDDFDWNQVRGRDRHKAVTEKPKDLENFAPSADKKSPKHH